MRPSRQPAGRAISLRRARQERDVIVTEHVEQTGAAASAVIITSTCRTTTILKCADAGTSPARGASRTRANGRPGVTTTTASAHFDRGRVPAGTWSDRRRVAPSKIVSTGRGLLLLNHHQHGARRSLLVSGDPTTSKSTAITRLGRAVELAHHRTRPTVSMVAAKGGVCARPIVRRFCRHDRYSLTSWGTVRMALVAPVSGAVLGTAMVKEPSCSPVPCVSGVVPWSAYSSSA
jgi:hypothetical protein